MVRQRSPDNVIELRKKFKAAGHIGSGSLVNWYAEGVQIKTDAEPVTSGKVASHAKLTREPGIMGKWAEVECVCSNRRPVPGSDYFFDRPHRKKQRLTKREREEVEEWERTTYQMFECGHRRGILIEFWPGEIINLGDLIGSIFKDQFAIFKRVGDWRSYDDELLLVQPDDAELWLMEIDEIRRALGGEGNLPSAKIEAVMLESFRQDLGTRLHLEQQLDDAAAKMPFARVNALRDNLAQTPRPELQSTIDKIYEAITDAAMLCQASIQTRNPIRLLW